MRTLVFFSALLTLAACTQTVPPDLYSIEQFYNNTRIGGGAFSEDETKLLVNSDESGIFNLYEIKISGCYKEANHFFGSRIIFCCRLCAGYRADFIFSG